MHPSQSLFLTVANEACELLIQVMSSLFGSHLTQRKGSSSSRSPQGPAQSLPTPPCLYLLPLLTWFQPHWASVLFLKSTGTVQSQGLCTCCSLCLEDYFPSQSHDLLPRLLRFMYNYLLMKLSKIKPCHLDFPFPTPCPMSLLKLHVVYVYIMRIAYLSLTKMPILGGQGF